MNRPVFDLDLPGTVASAPTLAPFGLAHCRLSIDPQAQPVELMNEAHCLLLSALSVFDAMTDAGAVPPTMRAGIYLLRQACAVVDAACGNTTATPTEGRPA